MVWVRRWRLGMYSGLYKLVIVTSMRGGQVDKMILLADNIREGAHVVGSWIFDLYFIVVRKKYF